MQHFSIILKSYFIHGTPNKQPRNPHFTFGKQNEPLQVYSKNISKPTSYPHTSRPQFDHILKDFANASLVLLILILRIQDIYIIIGKIF